MQPAQALVVPVESLLKPGNKQLLQVFLYNANGQFLRVAQPGEVQFSVSGKGSVDAAGRFAAPADAEHHAAIITAEVAGLKGQARVRIVPDFPWSFTFDDGIVPITGVGIRYRHIGLDFDLYQSLKQRDRLAARLYIALTTQFTNVPAPVAKYDDSTPANVWTSLKRYLDLVDTVTTQSSAKSKLDPALKLLQDERVLATWEWTGTEDTTGGQLGPQLQVTKGSRKVTGNGVLCKISTIPKGTRSQCWLGHPSSSDYEIQADFYAEGMPIAEGLDKNAKLADFGLICQRYRCDVLGTHQKLKLYSWISHDQKYFEQPFEWSADTWYTLKFRVTTHQEGEEPVAVLLGKVWKRGDPEPTNWSIRWTDRPGNLNGSPGLFGNAQNAEVFIDNLKVTSLERVQ
jgi:hypothetical protein